MCEVKVLNRVGLNQNSVSFKSRYPIQGHPDVLDEICKYLENKQTKKVISFIDIRIEPPKKSYQGGSILLFDNSGAYKESNCSTETEKGSIILFPPDLTNTKDIEQINGLTNDKPIFYASGNQEPIDIIITGKDKESFTAIGGPLDAIMKRTFEGDWRYITGNQIGFLIDKKDEIQKNILKGKPITTLAANVVKQFINFGKPIKEVVLDAREVFEKIKKGSFDIQTGLCLNA